MYKGRRNKIQLVVSALVLRFLSLPAYPVKFRLTSINSRKTLIWAIFKFFPNLGISIKKIFLRKPNMTM